MARTGIRLSAVLVCQLFLGAGLALAHCPEIHKSCDRTVRTCGSDADCSGNACTGSTCDLTVSSSTQCFITATPGAACTGDSSVTGAFDVQDFPTVPDQRIPDVGDLPIVEVSGNAVCAAGPSLPCVIGPAGSTTNGLPGAGTPGLVSFRSEHSLTAAQMQDLATANASSLSDQATVTVCTPGTNCGSTTTLQVSASSPVVSGCATDNPVQCDTNLCQVCVPESGQCVVDPSDPRCAPNVDIGVQKSADCVCGDGGDSLTAALGGGGDEVVVCGRSDDAPHSLTAASRGGHGDDDDDQGSNGNDHGDDDMDSGSGHGDDHGSVDHPSGDDDDHSGDDDDHNGDDDDHSGDDDDVPPPSGSPAGCTIGFTITATNHGSAEATNVVVDDALPSGLVVVDASASQGSFDSSTGAWLVGTLGAGASATLTIHADRGDAVGQCIENCAEVGSLDQTDSNPSNDSDCVTVFTGKSGNGTGDDDDSSFDDDHGSSHEGGRSGTSGDDDDDSSSGNGSICVPSGDHVCSNETVPAKWHKAYERWSKLMTKATEARSNRQAAKSLRKCRTVLRKMQRITNRFERGGSVSQGCIVKLRSRLEALSTQTRSAAR